MRLKLIVKNTTAPQPERKFAFAEGSVVLGRAEKSDIPLPGADNGASVKHAKIERSGEGFLLFDLGSTNGTSLNGNRVPANVGQPLNSGDEITVGRWAIGCELVSAPAIVKPVLVPSSESGRVAVPPPGVPPAPPPPPGATEPPPEGPAIFAPPAPPPEKLAALRGGEDPRVHEVAQKLVAVAAEADVLATTLQAELSQLELEEVIPLLTGLRQLAQGRADILPTLEAELDRQQGLRDIALRGMQSLSQRLLGRQDFSDREQVDRFRRLTEQTLLLTLEWVLDSISGRAAFTEKFGAKVTRFFGLDANPIKHALTPEQLGTYLLKWEVPREEGKIKDQLADAFRDLTAHQLSLVAGVQVALKAVLEQLDPQKHEDLAEETVSSWLPMRDLRLGAQSWTFFKTAYKDIFENDSKLFNEVIYPNVRMGYLKSHDQLGISGETDPGSG